MSYIKVIDVLLLLVTQIYDNGHVSSLQVSFSKSFTLSQDVKNYVLGLHNNFRAEVAAGRVGNEPKASVMNPMVWDDKIAAFAQESANKCDLMEHRKDRTLSGVGTVGENVGVAPLQKAIANDADIKNQFFANIGPTKNNNRRFYGWADEHNYFTYPRTCNSGEMCGHYTQMVWSTSTRVGCGIAQCSGCRLVGSNLCTNMYCNYFEGGNVLRDVDGQYVQDAPY